MIENQVNHCFYTITKVVEQKDKSLIIALDKLGPLQTSSIAYLDDVTKLQDISNKFWDEDILRDEVIKFLKNNKCEKN